MDVMNVNGKKDTKVASYPYKGKRLEVKHVWIRWLTQAGQGIHRNTAFDSLQ